MTMSNSLHDLNGLLAGLPQTIETQEREGQWLVEASSFCNLTGIFTLELKIPEDLGYSKSGKSVQFWKSKRLKLDTTILGDIPVLLTCRVESTLPAALRVEPRE